MKKIPLTTRPRSARPHRAFTLLELLVVVIVIAILAAIMMPSLAKAKASSYQTRCAANIRAQALAFHMYAADEEGHLAFPNWDQMDSMYTAAGWLYKAPIDTLVQPQEKNIESGTFWPYNHSYGLYRCPLDLPPYTKGPTQTFTSYIVNGAVVGYGQNKMPWAKQSAFAPSAVLIWEMNENTGGVAFNDGSTKPSTGATKRHGEGLTVGRADGGAEWISRTQFESELNDTPGRLWCSPFSQTGQ